MGRRHCAVPQYGFQASGTADTEGGAQEKAGRLHPSLGMGGDSSRLRTGTTVARQGWPPWGWKETGTWAKIHAQRGAGRPAPLLPNVFNILNGANSKPPTFRGAHTQQPCLFLGCGRAPLPPATPTGNALGTALLWAAATAVPPASGAPLGLHGAGNGAGASEPPTSAGSGDCGGL